MSLLHELKTILEHKRISNETKLQAVTEIVESYERESPGRTPIKKAEPTDRPETPARAYFKMTDKERNQIVNAHKKGMSVAEIARNVQRTKEAVLLVIKGYPANTGQKHRYHQRRMVTQTDIDTVTREFFHNGNTPKRIGKLIKRTSCAISAIISKVRSGRYKTSVAFDPKDRKTNRGRKPKGAAKREGDGTVAVSPETRMPAHFSHFG